MTIYISINGAQPILAPHEAPWLDDGRIRTNAAEYTQDAEFMALGGAVVTDPPPAFDAATHNKPAWVDGAWVPQPLTAAQLEARRLEALTWLGVQLEERLEAYIDSVAKAKRYKSTDRLIGYKGSTNPAWAADADAFIAWRDAVVEIATTLENDVAAGTKPPCTWEQLLAQFPPPPWPLPV